MNRMRSKTIKEDNVSKVLSIKAIDSIVLRKENQTHYGDMFVIVVWMLMIICEIKILIQSVLTELENEIWKERLKNKMCTVKYKVLPSKLYVVHTNSSQRTLKLNADFAAWNWTLSAFELPQVVKSISHETVSRIVHGYDHFRPMPTKIYVHPASITTYIEDVLRTPNASQVDLMRHEWARYQTYSSFPKTAKVQPIRLSMAGFYHTGTEDETACFSCGLRYRNWKPEDSPREIHQQISPDCAFLNGSDSRNVAIERPEDNTERHQQNERSESGNNSESLQGENGASGGSNESFPAANYQYASPRNHTERTMTSTREAETNGLHEGILRNVTSSLASSERRPPDISKDRAKHPYNAILSNRLASFTGWPGVTNHQPRDLASAGFYYVGTRDCVRCYFCGGGLRSWQNGDDPYGEHVRWYPDCDYIRICRGDEFLRQHSTDTNRSPETCDDQSIGNAPDISQKELEQNALRSTAAQSILSMGYTIQKVTQAMETFRMHQAGTDFTAEHLLELILDTEENQGNNISVASVSNSDTNPSENQKVSDSFYRELDVSSSSDFNCDSNRNEPSNARLDIEDSSDEIANSNDFESILDENRELKEQMTCKICMDAEACIVFLLCSHMMTCPQCAPAFRKCPICRALVRGTVRAFKS